MLELGFRNPSDDDDDVSEEKMEEELVIASVCKIDGRTEEPGTVPCSSHGRNREFGWSRVERLESAE